MKTHKMFALPVLVLLAFLSGCAGSPETAAPRQADTPSPQVSSPRTPPPEVPPPEAPSPEARPFKDTYLAGNISELVNAVQNILEDRSGNSEFTIEVTGNIAVNGPITLAQIIMYYNKVITIRGSGGEKYLTLGMDGSLFTIGNGLTLVLDSDITLQGSKRNNTALVCVNRGGELVLRKGSKITRNGNTGGGSDGGGVAVQTGGRLLVSGGVISENEASLGGGVYVAAKAFLDISDGVISDNSAAYHGGGVYAVNGTVNFSGGTVSGNRVAYTDRSSSSGGAGFYLSGGDFAISGGVIEDNVSSSAQGGGLSLTGGVTGTITAGTVRNNRTTSSGGGIYVSYATLNISGGEISGNQTTSSSTYSGQGGGIYIQEGSSSNKTAVTMTGGLISNNTATSGGGVYAVNSWYTSSNTPYSYGTTFTMKGGAISGNKAAKGGGLYLSLNSFIMSGKARINGNSADEGSGVYVYQSAITLGEEAGIDPDNAICLNYMDQNRHQSAIHIAGGIPGSGELARIELRGSSNVTGAEQWDQKILRQASGYKGELHNNRFTVVRFIPATNTNPAVPLNGYRIDSEGDLTKSAAAELTAEEYYDRGVASFTSKDYDGAITNFTEAIRLNSDYTEAYFARSALYFAKEDWDRAMSDFSEVLRLDPNHAGAYLGRGSTNYRKGNYARARADWEKALELDPNDVNARNNIETNLEALRQMGY
jgi:tetratricopeptide (TPR) repeat protein